MKLLPKSLQTPAKSSTQTTVQKYIYIYIYIYITKDKYIYIYHKRQIPFSGHIENPPEENPQPTYYIKDPASFSDNPVEQNPKKFQPHIHKPEKEGPLNLTDT
jgi:hypothetical protein